METYTLYIEESPLNPHYPEKEQILKPKYHEDAVLFHHIAGYPHIISTERSRNTLEILGKFHSVEIQFS